MQVNIWESPDRLLAALNGTYDRWGATRSYWNDVFRSQLRRYVDEWLDTGRESVALQKEKDKWDCSSGRRSPRFPIGAEVPGQRNIRCAAKVCAVATAYMRSHPPILASPTVSGYFPLVFGTSKSKSPDEEAARLFCVVLLSAQAGEWGARLAKCRYAPCGGYFWMTRLGRIYRNGTYCSRKHNKLASAGASTQRRRREHDEALIQFAACQLSDLGVCSPDWSRNRALKAKLVLRVNKHLRSSVKQQHRFRVTLNWVTRNAARIEGQRIPQ